MGKKEYAVVTPAKNEENLIEETIKCVISQEMAPSVWVIVSDGSTDRTDEIVKKYAEIYEFIHFLRIEKDRNHSFSSRVHTVLAGINYLESNNFQYDFLGFLDADISIGNNYYRKILEKFENEEGLGLAGGLVIDACGDGYNYIRRRSLDHVAGGVQFFRVECYEQIGGYEPLRLGGDDTIAETKARMLGWTVMTFPSLRVIHNKETGYGGRPLWMVRFMEGERDYLMGYHFIFLVAKCGRRLIEKPLFIGSFLRIIGFLYCFFSGCEREVQKDVLQYLQQEQIVKIKSYLGA